MRTAKREATDLLENLPDECTFEDIHYHLYVLQKIHRGLESARTEDTLSQEDAERRLSRWRLS